MSNDWFCPKCAGSFQPGSPVSCDCPPECGSGLDNGPCNCVDPKTHRVKLDRCGRCCGKCNRVYKVWYRHDLKYSASIKADSAVKARQAGLKGMHKAGHAKVTYLDMRARLHDRIPGACTQ